MTQDLKSVIEGYISARQLSSQYDDVRKRQANAKNLESTVGGITGENLGLVDNNSPEARQAKAAAELEKHYQGEAVKYIKANLATIVSSIDNKQAVAIAAATLKHNPAKTKDVGTLFSDYQLYSKFAAGPQKNENGEVDEAGYRKIQGAVIKKIPEVIARRIEAKTGDKELAKKWAAYLAPFAEQSEKYLMKVIGEELKRIEEELGSKMKSPSAIAGYIAASAEKDEEYMNYAMAVYGTIKQQEKAARR